jgi:hypothetical protein
VVSAHEGAATERRGEAGEGRRPVSEIHSAPGQVTVARTLEEVEALRQTWERLSPTHPTGDIDYLVTLVRTRPGVIRPHVVVAEKEGQPTSLAVGRVEDRGLPVKLGYKTVYEPRVRCLTIAPGGFVGGNGEDEQLILAELLAALARKEADVARLRLLRVGSPMHVLATTRTSALRRAHLSWPTAHWRARMPDTFAEFLQARSSKTRANVHRYSRRLERDYGDRLSLRAFRRPAEMDELFRETEAVYTKTYQHGLGVGFSDTDTDRQLTELALERGWFRGYVLRIDGEPVAFWHGLAYDRVFYTGATGYDPAHRDLRLGTYVLARMVESLCDDDVDWIDYGYGDAEYKRHFGDESWLEEDVLLFSRRARPLGVNLLRTAITGAGTAARMGLEKSRVLPRMRRVWRRRAAEERSS